MNNWIDQIEWDAIISEIIDGQCVLVIGPDLVDYVNNQTLFQLLCESLKEKVTLHQHVDISTQYVFEHEELLQLQPNGRDNSLYPFLREFYGKREELNAPYTQIAQLPFHLIISLLPDQRLGKVFEATGNPFQFDYYPRTKGGEKRELKQVPSPKLPLIYNIMGVLDPADAVLTFDNLFEYLQGILGDRPLPVSLDNTLKRAKSFLFLGVHFEKWYMQVLLRVFVPSNTYTDRRLKYSMLREERNKDKSTFIARIAERLELDFKSIEPLDFLQELHHRFSEKGLLKVPVKTSKKQVFISYSHQDKVIADDLRRQFEIANITVMMDEISMPAGEKIRNFMTRVNEVDKVVVVVSENSLKSPFVCKEIYLSLKNHKSLIPCYLDKYFLDKNHVTNTKILITDRLKEINRLISERKEKDPYDPVPDLMQEEELWREFGVYLPEQIAQLQGSKSIAINGDNYDNGVQQLIQNILS